MAGNGWEAGPTQQKAFHVGMVTWSQGKRTLRFSEPPQGQSSGGGQLRGREGEVWGPRGLDPEVPQAPGPPTMSPLLRASLSPKGRNYSQRYSSSCCLLVTCPGPAAQLVPNFNFIS